MTKDTKYLDDNNKDDDSILTEDMLKRFDESYERVKSVWLILITSLAEQCSECILFGKWSLTISMSSAKNREKINRFCFNYQIWHNISSIGDKRVCRIFFWAKSLGRVSGILWVTK